MVFSLPFAHIPSHFADDGGRGHDIDAVDLGQVSTGHAKQVRTQFELRFIAVLLLESCPPLLFWQAGALAPVLSPLEISFKLSIAFGHLLPAKLVTVLFLLQNEQQIFLPIAFQTSRDLLPTRLYTRVPKCGQLIRISLAGQNRVHDRLPCHTAHIAQHVRQSAQANLSAANDSVANTVSNAIEATAFLHRM